MDRIVGSGHYPLAGRGEHRNVKLGFIKVEEFSDRLTAYNLLKKNSSKQTFNTLRTGDADLRF